MRAPDRMAFAAISLAILVPGCNGSGGGDASPTGGALVSGAWQAVATVPGGPLRFRMTIAGEPDTPIVHLANGNERVLISDVSVVGNRYVFRLPAFNSTIDATLEDSALVGTLTLVKRGGTEQVMPFRAVPAGPPALQMAGANPIDITGRWKVSFVDDEGNTSEAIGEFVGNDHAVTGTFLTATGDYRYLAGEITGREFYLSCFDGAHAFLFTARVESDGSLAGDFWSGTRWHETWTAIRDSSAVLPDPGSLTLLSAGQEKFTFDFPDAHHRHVTNDDPRFTGKVLIVTLSGSWCPNCHDEAAFLASLYRNHHAAGLEAVGLMYEHYRDFERAAVQVQYFAEKFGIEYPLLIAGYSDKGEAARTLAALDRVVAFPTMIVIDRRGAVRRIHTGFTGPGTGHHYDTFRREFTQFIEGLLDEQI